MTRALAALVAAALYLVARGHPAAPGSGVPIGLSGLVALVALGTAVIWTRTEPRTRRPPVLVIAGLFAAVIIKLGLGLVAAPAGWLGTYYANDAGAPPMERSTDFPALVDATRVDEVIAFDDDAFPVHFFNHQRYSAGDRREVSEPFSASWTGHLHRDTASELTLVLEARGAASVRVDGLDVITSDRADGIQASAVVPLGAGFHSVDVRYQKPAHTVGLIRLLARSGDAPPALEPLRVTTRSVAPWRGAWDRTFLGLAWATHAFAAALIIGWLAPSVSRRLKRTSALARHAPVMALGEVAVPAVVLLLAAQGAWKARSLVGRVWTMSGGDDWLAYESQARDVLLNGILMPLGATMGEGRPFLYYPGYTYMVALVHRLGGESLASVVFVNFLLLGIAFVVVYHLARLLTGPGVALVALAWIFVLGQLDFVRYYTVTLLSENLFFAVVPACVYALAHYLRGGSTLWMLGAAAAGGCASLTRPSMMLFLPPAALLIVAAKWRPAGRIRACALAAAFVLAWLVTVSPATIRNYLVSGDPVLITAGQAATFVTFNLPPGDHPQYKAAFEGTLVSAARVLLWILVEHPAEMLAGFGEKLLFSFGMVHRRTGYALHPELLLTSACYLLALVTVPAARTLAAAAVHLFILTHLATLLLTQPWNYGYRMLLVMFLLMPVFGAAAAARLVPRRSRDAVSGA